MSNEGQNSTGETDRQTTAFTQQADSPSTESSIPHSDTQSTAQNVSNELTDEQNARRQRLEAFVAEFREGKKSRIEAYSDILRELDREPELTQEEKETTFGVFSAEIDSTEARARRRLTIAKSSAQAIATQSNRCQDEQSGEDSGTEIDEDRPKKKSKLLESEMPWNAHSELDVPRNNPASAKTVELLRTYNRDIKQCKFFVSISSGAPNNIPTAQWERIFKGEPIDLDQILSALYRITINEDQKARVGEADISLGPVEASRKVSSSTDWSAAWRRAARAIAFAFPHRVKELEDYAEYIENEFAAKNHSSHHRIILYDVAIRNLVRGRQQMLLTDIHRFVSLYSAIVMPDGIQYGSQRGTIRKREELCNRFNNKGCKVTNCRYQHACKGCGSTAHGKSKCDASSRN